MLQFINPGLKKAMTENRRRFSRIDFDARVELAQGTKHMQAQILDISLKGVLLAKMGLYQVDPKAPILVKIILSDQTCISMSTQLIHQTLEQLRLGCINIDLDSVSHLRRLVELNLGDTKAADRELAELISTHH